MKTSANHVISFDSSQNFVLSKVFGYQLKLKKETVVGASISFCYGISMVMYSREWCSRYLTQFYSIFVDFPSNLNYLFSPHYLNYFIIQYHFHFVQSLLLFVYMFKIFQTMLILPHSMCAPVMVELEGETDPLLIAMKELK